MQLNIFAPNRASPSPQNVCTEPLTAPANQGHTVSSRRAQVRREVREAMERADRMGLDPALALQEQVGRNAARLAPGGTWIRGQASRADGNRLYGAITAELGVPLRGALWFGDIDELFDDTLGWLGIRPYDGNFGTDSQAAKDQIREGVGC